MPVNILDIVTIIECATLRGKVLREWGNADDEISAIRNERVYRLDI